MPTSNDPDVLTAARDKLVTQKQATDALARKTPHNPGKAGEYGAENAQSPMAGQHFKPDDDLATASTVHEDIGSDKLGSGIPPDGVNPGNDPLDRVRVDSGGQTLSTNQGLPVADNQHSLKAGSRGPVLLEDFILREKITHFDHERIPERVVHARGSGAHGVFVCTESMEQFSRADLFSSAGKETPVFVRFSTVAGERGSADTVRDTRGFAVKFYTDEGNWDLVGNNIPVFFIQDAMKFPDVVHAVKPEPHHAMPQASSAHDTFWDFISLMPESIHHTLWAMSDRGIPRSYRMMQGFGVHTFRLVNDAGESCFVKFHWLPHAGTHALVWDEAVKINGADPDFHRRDLWEAIEAGAFPKYDLALQVFSEEQAESFSFDVLDPTKLVPEELVPLRVVGTMTLNRNPDNFFAETEQVAFCASHIVPGIDFSNDPLLQGRLFSYQDTQLTRLGGPNFHEIPINASVCPVHNNQRDGFHRQAIVRGRVSYEPNSLAGGCPHQAGQAGFRTVAEPMRESKMRIKPEKFADHFSQAKLFLRSQTPPEREHLQNALRFELGRLTVPAIRERMVGLMRHVDETMAQWLADELGMREMPPTPPAALASPVESEIDASPGLSMFARPGDGSVAGRRVALIVADGMEAAPLQAALQTLAMAGAVPRMVGTKLGRVQAADGSHIEVDTTFLMMPSVLWDAVVLPAGTGALPALVANGQVLEFIKDQYRHCKPIWLLGGEGALLEAAGIPYDELEAAADPGLILDETGGDAADVTGADDEDDTAVRFLHALARHRHFEREMDPPAV